MKRIMTGDWCYSSTPALYIPIDDENFHTRVKTTYNIGDALSACCFLCPPIKQHQLLMPFIVADSILESHYWTNVADLLQPPHLSMVQSSPGRQGHPT